MASIKLSTSVYAVRMRRSVSGETSRLWRHSSTPFIPGIRKSVSITATSPAARSGSAAAPDSARTTRNSAARIASRASSTRGSSSTTRTVASDPLSIADGFVTKSSSSPLSLAHRRWLAQRKDLVQRLAALQSLELRRAQRAVLDERLDVAEGALRGDYMSVEQPCHALDAGRGDHRPPHDDELAPLGRADGARHDRPRRDAHPDVEPPPPGQGPLRRELPDRRDHVERRGDGAPRGIARALGDAEEDHDLVADELLDGALVAEDHLEHPVQVSVEQPDHHRGGRGLDQTRVAADVREDDGGLAPVGGGLEQVGVVQRHLREPGRYIALQLRAHAGFAERAVLVQAQVQERRLEVGVLRGQVAQERVPLDGQSMSLDSSAHGVDQ